jgi:hypothetical protein
MGSGRLRHPLREGGIGRSLAAAVLAAGCAVHMPATPAPGSPAARVRFAVVGEAAPTDSRPPEVRAADGVIMLQGNTRRVEGGGVYADVDLSVAGTVRLTLYY